MFKSLRTKLVLSHVSIALLVLLLSMGAGALVVKRVQLTANLARTRSAALVLAQRLRQIPQQSVTDNLLQRLQENLSRSDASTLLVDSEGNVLHSGLPDLDGKRVPTPSNSRRLPLLPASVRRYQLPNGKHLFLVYVELSADAQLAGARFLAMALPVESTSPPWRTLFAPLARIAVIVVLLAALVAYLIAASITRPVTEITTAAEAVARGEYDHPLEEASGSGDEIGRLAASFSHMAREIQRTQRAQKDFVANISHDLKTPLTSIQGFAQAMREGTISEPDEYQRAADIIHRQAQHMSDLIGDLLELARLDAGHLDREPLRLDRLVREEIQRLEPLAQQRDLEIDAAAIASPIHLQGDGKRLCRAIRSLLDNAVKYANRGTNVEVTAKLLAPDDTRPEPLAFALGREVENGAWIYLEITNAGGPIPNSELPRLFERFYRGDKSRRHGEGSGLGLAIAKEVILAHGGRLEVSGNDRGKVRFRVWLLWQQPSNANS